MLLSSADITAWVGQFMWPFTRIGALVAAMPVVGTEFLPVRVRLSLALALTAVVMPNLPPMPAVDPLSPTALLITFNQIAIGVTMGFVFQLVFAAFVVGAQTVAMKIGLGFATMVDPVAGGQLPVLATLYSLMVSMLFLSFNGHLALFELLADSFRLLPVGTGGLSREAVWAVLQWSQNLFVGALRVAIPALAALLVVQLAFGVVTKAAPQFNIFSVGMPIFMLMGMFVLVLTMPGVVDQFGDLLAEVFILLRQVLGDGGGHG